MTQSYLIDRSTTCLLPIGIYRDGKYHREVTLDKWRGEDHEKLTAPAGKANPGGVVNGILCRLIQEIPGVLPRKADPWDLAPKEILEEMFTADIDFLLLQSLAASKRNTVQTMEFSCQHCDEELEQDVDLCDIKVKPHDSTLPPYFEFTLEDGIALKGADGGTPVIAKSGKFFLPTGRVRTRIAKSGAKGELSQFTEMLSACIAEFEVVGRITPFMAKRKMTFDDRNNLLDKVNQLTAGADVKQDVVCYACGKSSQFSIEVSRFFF